MYIIIAILVFGVLVAVHELGHFLAAKAFGVRVNEFSIGMGPALVQTTKGDTDYSLRLLPIGGFCAMEGEEGDSGDPKALNNKSLFARFIIFAAGAFMNFVAGFLLLVLLLSFGGRPFYAPVITGFAEGFTAQGEQGLMPGDRVLSIDGERVLVYEDVSMFLNLGDKQHYDFVVERNGEKVVLPELALAPQMYPDGRGGERMRFGIDFGETMEKTPLVTLKLAALNSVDYVRMVWYSLGMLISGQVGLNDMSGPVGIVSTISAVGNQSASTWLALINIGYLAALIAVNLAVMNLLPLPALDGGQIFIMLAGAAVSKITGKPVDPKYAGYLNYAGFVALMVLMLVITANDILKLFA